MINVLILNYNYTFFLDLRWTFILVEELIVVLMDHQESLHPSTQVFSISFSNSSWSSSSKLIFSCFRLEYSIPVIFSIKWSLGCYSYWQMTNKSLVVSVKSIDKMLFLDESEEIKNQKRDQRPISHKWRGYEDRRDRLPFRDGPHRIEWGCIYNWNYLKQRN